MENKLIAIGELLIDFLGSKTEELKNVPSFIKNPGGAPANVAVCFAKLGGNATFITKLGNDAFGDYLIDVLKNENVDVSQVSRTAKANTPLAFVSLKENGERDFSFYRNPSSDLFLDKDDIAESIFKQGDIFHFGSVDLVDYPVKRAHKQAIEYAHKHKMLVSFDPNLRFSLWNDINQLKQTVLEFLPLAHIIKLSEEELFFLTNISNQDQAVKSIFSGNIKLVIITKGPLGADIYNDNMQKLSHSGFKVNAIDTTGAGDSFIGSFLFQLQKNKITLDNLVIDFNKYQQYLIFANKVASIVVTRYGAIPAMPTLKEVEASLS